ncbi:hypothetical protein SAMN00017477_1045 [Peptoniphilus asaccharolyticus DSM 20463]|uniref:Uncharacterized protein n=1 Tax=Peptoniphilus asaccharolyticus DSM 20463 TaxID=573058 RepID=A0A1W1V2E1_PEPAS|nr:hypothetical protein [Peptoniphilus asaccharolyticus]MBL7575541.1 hypothetical protein [Peptoniphilus asaccharolyticus]SMB87191.1 hypothetical protein SAMN00017477_1045 [Peptoniphilus asaccharolyticus DSM 20463]
MMISESKLLNYASNFLESEIEQINKLLSEENRSQEDRYILTRLKREYERDLEEIGNAN